MLGIEKRTLHVRSQDLQRRGRKPIDVFFSALAEDVGELAAGVVLSGGDSEDTLGIEVIKANRGLTIAQAADDCGPHHADMPESAISTGLIDFALPAEEMGAKLARFTREASSLDGFAEGGEHRARHAQVAIGQESKHG